MRGAPFPSHPGVLISTALACLPDFVQPGAACERASNCQPRALPAARPAILASRGWLAPGEPPRRARAAEEAEETGWKYIHGDVFRPPRHLSLFCACVGTGTQMLAMAACICALALAGVFFPYNRGALLTACVVRGAPRRAPPPRARPSACAPALRQHAAAGPRGLPTSSPSGVLLPCSQGRPARPCARLT